MSFYEVSAYYGLAILSESFYCLPHFLFSDHTCPYRTVCAVILLFDTTSVDDTAI